MEWVSSNAVLAYHPFSLLRLTFPSHSSAEQGSRALKVPRSGLPFTPVSTGKTRNGSRSRDVGIFVGMNAPVIG